MGDPYKDERARIRHERDRFKSLSTAKRKEWRALKQARRPQQALEAMDRMHEYAQTARHLQAALDSLPTPSESQSHDQ